MPVSPGERSVPLSERAIPPGEQWSAITGRIRQLIDEWSEATIVEMIAGKIACDADTLTQMLEVVDGGLAIDFRAQCFATELAAKHAICESQTRPPWE